MLWKVEAGNLPLGPRGLAVAMQEKQQKGQEEQDGGWKKDAEEGLHIFLGGTYLLGALELGNGIELEDGERRPLHF